MDTVFEALYFLTIGLLAITITIFVLAVSLLGRAVKLSLEEQEKTEENRKADTEKSRSELKEQLDQATYNRKALEKSLEKYKVKVDRHNRALRWIRWKPKFLKTNWGVFIPSAFFIMAIVIISLARYQLGQFNTNYQYLYFGTSVFLLLVGIGFICLTLKVIEGVSITSEEIAFTRESEALKKALIDVEEAKRPELSIKFRKIEFPLYVAVNTETKIQVEASLIKADIAEDVSVRFYISPELDFKDETTLISTTEYEYPKFKLYRWENLKMLRGLVYRKHLTIKSPSISNTYKMAYYWVCKSALPSNTIEVDIIVE